MKDFYLLPSETTLSRFCKWHRALKQETGDKATMTAKAGVIVHRNEFSPERRFRSLQEAIDAFAHILGTDF